jgi:hypothetical protein
MGWPYYMVHLYDVGQPFCLSRGISPLFLPQALNISSKFHFVFLELQVQLHH